MSDIEQTDSEKAEAEAIAASKLLADQDAEAQAAALIADEPIPVAPQIEPARPMGPSGAVAIQAFLAKKQAEEDAKALAG